MKIWISRSIPQRHITSSGFTSVESKLWIISFIAFPSIRETKSRSVICDRSYRLHLTKTTQVQKKQRYSNWIRNKIWLSKLKSIGSRFRLNNQDMLTRFISILYIKNVYIKFIKYIKSMSLFKIILTKHDLNIGIRSLTRTVRSI